MVALRRTVFSLMIPLNLFCIGWVWLGRLVFEIGGWMLLIFTVLFGPAMLIGLALTSILAFTQRVPAERGRLTLAQALAHLALWVAMLGYGYFLVDTTDAPNSDRSVFTLTAGDESLSTSFDLSYVFLWASVACYVLLLVLLIVGQRNRSRHPAAPNDRQQPQAPPPPPQRR